MRTLANLCALAVAAGCAHSTVPHRSAAPAFRRIVTGFDAAGRSTILLDGRVSDAHRFDGPTAEEVARQPWLRGISGYNPWFFESVPTSLVSRPDALLTPAALAWAQQEGVQPPGGAVGVQVVRYEPGVEFPMHATATVDIIAVISGRLELVLETGSTVLGPGDVAVQRGTPHAWRVVGREPCLFLAVLVDAEGSPLPPAVLDKYPMPAR